MSVDSVYKYIVFDVIRNIKSSIKLDSEGETVEEGIIDEIQTMWLDRLLQAGAITNEPDETTQVSQSVQQQKNIESENVRNTLNSLIQLNSNKQTTTTTTTTTSTSSTFGTPQPYMAPRENNSQVSPSLNSNNNSNNNLPSSLRSIMNPIPQNDGALDTEDTEEQEEEQKEVEQDKNSKEYIDDLIITGFLKNKFNINGDVIPQNDGNDDDDDDDLDEEEGNSRGVGNSNKDEDLLGSDLDDDEDDDPDPIIDHYVLCQYEKVSRIKNKRKCNFKDGIMHLNGKDSLFNKANGEMVWL